MDRQLVISVRSSAGSANTGPVTVTKPAGTASGDHLVAFQFQGPFWAASGMSAPAGWVQTGSTGGDGTSVFCKIWALPAGASEPTDYTFPATYASVVIIVCVIGQDATTPLNIAPVFTVGPAGLAEVAPSVTPTVANALLLCAWAQYASSGAASYTPDPAMIEQGDFQALTVASVDSQALTTGAGVATGTRTATCTAIDNAYVSVSLAIAPVAGTAPAAPANSVAPVASGTPSVGSVLTTTDGTWLNTPTSFAYQWKRNGVAISGQTSSTYTVVSGDQGTTLTAAVTATNATGSATATSNGISIPAAPVAPDIQSVVIGADGWYADITIGGLSTGGTYAFGLGANNDPDAGTPKLTLTATSLGFDTGGNPTTVARTIYGTKEVRQPYPTPTLNQETLGAGNVTVRVALSDYVYAKDNVGAGNSGTAPTVTISAGLYTQGGTPNNAATGLTVTNNSTRAYPKIVGNWSWPGYDKLGATFTARAVAFHISAAAGRPVQCVKFTATDTHANAVTVTVTAPTVDTTSGDAVPVVEYGAIMSAAALTQGDVVTLNFVAYPRVGDVAALLDTATGTAQPTPLYGPILAVCDKAGTYATSVAVVDPTGGNDGTGAVTGAFLVGSPPASYRTMAAAFTALRAYNLANYGRNNCGGSTLYLKDGVHPWVNGTVSVGTAPDAWLTVAKFPTSVRDNVTIGDQVGGQSLGLRVKLQDVRITGQSAIGNISPGAGSHLWIDRCEINCPVVGNPPFYSNTVWYTTRSLVTAFDQGFHPYSIDTTSPALVRGNTVVAANGTTFAYTVLGNTMPASVPLNDAYPGQTIPQSVNTVVAYNKMSGPIGGNTPVTLKLINSETHGCAFIQNLVEITVQSVSPAVQITADTSHNTPVENVLIWQNTIVGQRINTAYNEDDVRGAAYRIGWSLKNNVFDSNYIKTDTFAGSGFLANGNKIGNWSLNWGCGCSGNMSAYTAGISIGADFIFEFPGLRCNAPAESGDPPSGASNPIGYIGFVNRASYNGSAPGAGGGDYHLLSSSPAYALQRDHILPFDLAGLPRAAGTAPVGAYALAVTPTGFIYLNVGGVAKRVSGYVKV